MDPGGGGGVAFYWVRSGEVTVVRLRIDARMDAVYDTVHGCRIACALA